jgi:hypothetical protein
MNTYTLFEIFIVKVSSSVNNTGYVTPRKLNNTSLCLIYMHMNYFFYGIVSYKILPQQITSPFYGLLSIKKRTGLSVQHSVCMLV